MPICNANDMKRIQQKFVWRSGRRVTASAGYTDTVSSLFKGRGDRQHGVRATLGTHERLLRLLDIEESCCLNISLAYFKNTYRPMSESLNVPPEDRGKCANMGYHFIFGI
jgi:hypothetical protein